MLTIYPPEYRAWAATAGVRPVSSVVGTVAGHGFSRAVPPAALKGRPTNDGTLQIANPPAGAIYSVDPTLRREFQALPLRVVTGTPTTVTWLVNGTRIGTASSERSLSWPLAVGAHHIEVRDAAGRRATTSVIVK